MRNFLSEKFLSVFKYFNIIDHRSINASKNTLKMLTNKGFSLFLSFLNVPIFLSCIDKTQYGIWLTMFSIVNWIAFLDIGLGQGLRNKLAIEIAKDNYNKSKELVSTAYYSIGFLFTTIIILFSIISLFVNWSYIFNTPESLQKEVNIAFIIIVIFMCMTFILRLFESICHALQKSAITSNIILIIQAVSVISIFIISKTIEKPSLVLLGLSMSIIPVFIYTIYSIKYFNSKFKLLKPSISNFKKKYLRDLLSIGIEFFIIQLLSITLTLSGNFILTNLTSPEQVPEYYLANKFFSMLTMIFMIITVPYWSATTDAFEKKEFMWIKKNFKFLFKILLFILVVGLIMLFGSKFIFRIWTNNLIFVRFELSLLIYIYSSLFMMSNLLHTFINGMGRLRVQLFSTILASITFLTIAIVLGKSQGSIGIAIASIVSYTMISLISFIHYKKLVSENATGIWNK